MDYRQESRGGFPIEQDGVSLRATREFIAEFGEKTFLTEQFLMEGGASRFFQQVAAMEKNGEIKPPFWGETSSYLRHFPSEVRSALIKNLFGELSIVYLKKRFSGAGLTVLDSQQTSQWLKPALEEIGFRGKKDPANKSKIYIWQREDGQDQITIPDGLVIFEWASRRCILSFIDHQMAGQESHHFGLKNRLVSFENLARLLTSKQEAPIIDYLGRHPPFPFGGKPCHCPRPENFWFHSVFPGNQNVEVNYSGKGQLRVEHLPFGRSELRLLGNALIKDHYKIEEASL